MQSVLIKPNVRYKVRDLFDALFSKKYLSLEENARASTDKVFDFILDIPSQKHRLTKNKRWGQYFARYKPNRRTSWYVTFNKEINETGELYIVKNIFNNHVKGYAHFITDEK